MMNEFAIAQPSKLHVHIANIARGIIFWLSDIKVKPQISQIYNGTVALILPLTEGMP